MKTICIIPARGGSKGIPRKNLAKLGKWSLLEHTIADAYELKCPIYVTTDDDEIGYIAQEADCVYMKRPKELAGDDAQIEDAVIDVLERLNTPPETIVVMMQPTSPFRFPGEVADAVELFKKSLYTSVFSAYELYPFLWIPGRNSANRLRYGYKKRPNRQDKSPSFVEDGSFYITLADVYYTGNNRLTCTAQAWIHNKIYGIEVDTPEDLELCQQLLPWLKSSGKV